MHRFGKKEFVLAGIVVLFLAILAFATRSSMQTAGADTGNAIEIRNAQIREALRMAEGR